MHKHAPLWIISGLEFRAFSLQLTLKSPQSRYGPASPCTKSIHALLSKFTFSHLAQKVFNQYVTRDEQCQLRNSVQTESSVRALQPVWVFALTEMESESRTHTYAIGSLFSLNQSVVSHSHWVATPGFSVICWWIMDLWELSLESFDF